MTTILKESISIVIFREFFLIFHSEEGIYPFVLSLLKHIEKWDYWCSHKAELGQQKKNHEKRKRKKSSYLFGMMNSWLSFSGSCNMCWRRWHRSLKTLRRFLLSTSPKLFKFHMQSWGGNSEYAGGAICIRKSHLKGFTPILEYFDKCNEEDRCHGKHPASWVFFL